VRMLLVLIGFMVALSNGRELPSPHLSLQGHQIWQLNKASQEIVQRMELEGLVDILDHSTGQTIAVAPCNMNDVTRMLQEHGVEAKVSVPDLQQFLENRDAEDLAQQQRERELSGRAGTCTQSKCPTPLTDDWMTFQQMGYYLEHISQSYPDRVTVSSVGKSHENRDIWMVHIKSGGCNPTRKERMAWWAQKPKAIWLEGGMHAREWISPSVCLQMIDRFINDCATTRLYDVYVAPMANPDGYEYSRTNNRLQRKNRARNGGSSCRGVDLNRNWDYKWGVVGTSSNPCSEVYKGSNPFSEPETRSLSNAMKQIKDLELYISFHSYSQVLLYPWGWTTGQTSPDTEEMERMAKVFTDTATARHGTYYYHTNSATGFYPAAGCSDDWVKGSLGVKYSYTLELRDRGNYGFSLPRNQILPTGQEVWDGLKMLLAAIRPNKVIPH
ncbi:unnamed protein product, partial [Meganyctiphanes norvegica]